MIYASPQNVRNKTNKKLMDLNDFFTLVRSSSSYQTAKNRVLKSHARDIQIQKCMQNFKWLPNI